MLQMARGGDTLANDQKEVGKRDLKHLIKASASGDDHAARRLVSPFINSDERLLIYGISAKFGLIPTYDFLFLTDRRIGDLEITPLTGNLNVEVAFLQKIDAFVLSQPAFPLLLRAGMWMIYPLLALYGFAQASSIGYQLGSSDSLSIIVALGLSVIGILIGFYAINPAIRRAFLRLKKSGLWCKLQGNPVGVLIFADRDKFSLLASVTRQVTEVKRQLDKVAM